MAMLLAPYNSAMRRGQGFNSYTQQICIDNAVVVDPDLPGGDAYDTRDKGPENTSQIVTYSSRYVDKISDVTDSMNISGSLSIKTSTIGGAANGSYIDTDKFHESNINFHIQVKVTNQTILYNDVLKFQPIHALEPSRMTEVFGDCFISGFVEGGDFNALVSIKTNNADTANEIKGHLEASLNVAALSGTAEVDADIAKSKLTQSTETTITVNWNGGGAIKDKDQTWDIKVLQQVAAKFPDLVAAVPQRTYAILTKYTSLRSFQDYAATLKISPLDYDNAGLYTSALLDGYMDYKNIWKQLSLLACDYENQNYYVEMASLQNQHNAPNYAQDLIKYGQSLADQEKQGKEWFAKHPYLPKTNGTAGAVAAPATAAAADEEPDEPPLPPLPFVPYEGTLLGVVKARIDCRLEMCKIVREVDLVTKDPRIASDPFRAGVYMSPAIFRQLIPVRGDAWPKQVKITPLPVANGPVVATSTNTDPSLTANGIPAIYNSPFMMYPWDTKTFPLFPTAQTSLAKYRLGSGLDQFIATPWAGQAGNSNHATEFCNDLDLNIGDVSGQIDSLTIYCTTIKSPGNAKQSISAVVGIYIIYTNGRTRQWGIIATQPPDYYFSSMKMNPGERIDKVSMYTAKLPGEEDSCVAGLRFGTSSGRTMACCFDAAVRDKKNVLELKGTRPLDLLGFYGEVVNPGRPFHRLGVFWRKC